LQYATNAKVSSRKTAHRGSIPLPFPNASDENIAPIYEPLQMTHRPSLWNSAEQQPPNTAPKSIFDDSLSGFDETESVVFGGRQDMLPSGAKNTRFAGLEDDYDEVETVVEGDSRSEGPTSPRGGISGRFYQPPQGQKQHTNMELLPHKNGTSTEQKFNDTKKRNPFSDPIDVRGKQERGKDGIVRPSNFDASSSGEDSASDMPNGGNSAGGLLNIQNSDYNDQQLDGMTYQVLKDETWESEKHGRTSTLPQELQDPAIPLGKRFNRCLNLDGNQKETQDMHIEFFAKMSTTEWEETGDLFIERFAEIMKGLKEARQAKRNIATNFEKSIEQREAAIRQKSEKLDKDLADMRKGGEGVIRGKAI
jgi:hypothetical protein